MGERRKYAVGTYTNNVDFIPGNVDGVYGIPCISPEPYIQTEYLPFNIARSIQYKRNRFGIHFFVSDYQFENLWARKEKYRNMLPGFAAVMSPDFSLYTDWPFTVQLWNHYRKHVIGAWMQSIGCLVYPTISWSDKNSYDWCFDGEPTHATVCVSSIGTQKSRDTKKLFLAGYEKMMEKLEPETVIFYGQIPKECTGNIVHINPFHTKFYGGE